MKGPRLLNGWANRGIGRALGRRAFPENEHRVNAG
jgi:hypothetical protein